MVQQFYNPFSGDTFSYPKEQQGLYEQYTRFQKSDRHIDESPFERYIDLWFAGLTLAASRGLAPADDTRDFVRSTNLVVLNQDPWRVQMIMLVAIAVEDEVEVIRQPGRMMSLANRLAAVGVPKVAEMLRSGDAEPIWNLSDEFEAMLNDGRDI